MSQAYDPSPDEDLTPHFRWCWSEHGIYVSVCGFISLFVLVLHLLPRPPEQRLGPPIVEVIQVRYLSAADEPPAKQEPFRDPRLLPRRQASERVRGPM